MININRIHKSLHMVIDDVRSLTVFIERVSVKKYLYWAFFILYTLILLMVTYKKKL